MLTRSRAKRAAEQPSVCHTDHILVSPRPSSSSSSSSSKFSTKTKENGNKDSEQNGEAARGKETQKQNTPQKTRILSDCVHPGKKVAQDIKTRRSQFLQQNNLPDNYFEYDFYEDADLPKPSTQNEVLKQTSTSMDHHHHLFTFKTTTSNTSSIVPVHKYNPIAELDKARIFSLVSRPWYRTNHHGGLNEILQRAAPGSHIVAPMQEHYAIVLSDPSLTWFIDDANFYRIPMQASQCHDNVQLLFQKRAITSMYTGYALSADGLWRYHSWGVDANNGGLVLETTEPRVAYFGVKVDPKDVF